MTPLPKRKHTRSRSGKRRNSQSNRLLLPNLVVCPNCKKLKLPHKLCENCQMYS